MKTVKVLSGQAFVDLSMQETDSAENAVRFALLNGRSVTDDLGVGEEVTVPADLAYTGRLFDGLRHKPASFLTDEEIDITDQLPPERDSWRIFDYTFDELFN